MNKSFDDMKRKALNIFSDLASKTGNAAGISKLTFEIKKLEIDIRFKNEKIGAFVFSQAEKGEQTVSINDANINTLIDDIRKFHTSIDVKKKEIVELKEKLKTKPDNNDDTIG